MAIMNVDRWLRARMLWRWENEAIVNRLADDSRRKQRRSQRGKWAM